MKRYKLTWIGLGVAILIGVFSYIFDLDPFDELVYLFTSVEKYEIDELFVATIVFLVFLVADLLLQERKQRIEREKVKVYKAMIASAHHILNNFLNQMQLFMLTAEMTPGFDKDVLATYDKIIEETTQQIEALSNLTEISENAIHESVRPRSEKEAKEKS